MLQADGGTRCAAICGAYVAARRALDRFGLSQGAHGLGRGGLRRHRRRRAAARPRVHGGLDRGGRHERRHDRRRPPGRGAGDGRARAVLARAARRAARPRRARGSRRSPRRSARRSRRRSSERRRSGPDPRLGRGPPAGSRSRPRSAAAIGFERELREREAGLRTHMLVCLGSALFTIVSAYGFHEFLTSGGAGRPRRPDAHRGADRHRHRLPRRRRDHPPGHLGPRADDRGDAVGRGGDRHGGRRRLLPGRGDRHRRSRSSRSGRSASLAYPIFERLRPEERSIVVDLRAGTQRRRSCSTRWSEEHARVEHFQLEDEHDRRVVTLTLDTPSEKLLASSRDLDFVQGVEWGAVARLCSKNEGKLRELRAALPGLGDRAARRRRVSARGRRDVLRERARRRRTSAARSSPTCG